MAVDDFGKIGFEMGHGDVKNRPGRQIFIGKVEAHDGIADHDHCEPEIRSNPHGRVYTVTCNGTRNDESLDVIVPEIGFDAGRCKGR